MQELSHTTQWKLEEIFYAFDKPPHDNCIPITVYKHPIHSNGHAITQYGNENITFWFFAYSDNKHPSLHHSNPTQYHVYDDNDNNKATYHILKDQDIQNNSSLIINQTLSFSFYAFEYDGIFLFLHLFFRQK